MPSLSYLLRLLIENCIKLFSIPLSFLEGAIDIHSARLVHHGAKFSKFLKNSSRIRDAHLLHVRARYKITESLKLLQCPGKGLLVHKLVVFRVQKKKTAVDEKMDGSV